MNKEKKGRKIRILFLIDQIFSAHGGSEKNLSFLLRCLPEDDFEVYLSVVKDTGYRNTIYFPDPHHCLTLDSLSSPRVLFDSVKRLVAIIRKRKIDIVHTFFPDSEIVGILATRIVGSCILVVSRRNMGFWHTKKSLWKTRLTNQLIPNFVANCHAIKMRIIKLEFISSKKIKVIYNPIIKRPLAGDTNQTISRQDFGIKEDDFLIGMIANVRPIKGHDTLIRAAHYILERRPKTKFIFAGHAFPENKKPLDALVNDLDIGRAIIFAGEIENPDLLMKLFDLGVLSSKSEGLSNTLIEYSAHGLPVVATDVGGTREIVVDGCSGYLVPPSDPVSLSEKIIRLIDNAGLRCEFGDYGKKVVNKKFCQESIVSKYTEFYRSLCN